MLRRSNAAGFSLIELMVALVAGLIITFAVTSFVAMTISNSSATVRATRLTQELRALTEVVAREVRRARSVQDPISRVGTGCTAASTCNFSTITVSAGCILYSYAGAAGGDFRAVRRVATDGVGSLVLASGAVAPTCDTAGTQLNSSLVDVTAFDVAVDATNASRIDISISGRMIGDSAGTIHTFRTTVYVRSG